MTDTAFVHANIARTGSDEHNFGQIRAVSNSVMRFFTFNTKLNFLFDRTRSQ